MDTEDRLVVFQPSGRRGRFALGTPLLDAARSLGVYIESVCGGRAMCARCQIEVTEGRFDTYGVVSSNDHLSPMGESERRWKVGGARRMSCQARIMGDLVVDVPSEFAVNRQVVRKRAEVRRIALDTATKLVCVSLPAAEMEHPIGDADRLIEAIEAAHGYRGLVLDVALLDVVQGVVQQGMLTAAVHEDADRPVIVGLWPGARMAAFGVAFDIGSTTIAGHLVDLVTGRAVASAGTANPQIRFGEDLMSRVSYVMMNPDGREALTQAVRGAIASLVSRLAGQAGILPGDILEAVLVGNPVMHHLFLGIDPSPLGQAPFALAVSGALRLCARDLGLGLHPGARVYLPPCIAGHVGADAASVALAEGPQHHDEVTLVIDVGTNAEILLGTRARVLAASSPTGPAFEGAQISAGQRAAPGAIERVRIDPLTFEPRIKVLGVDPWSDEPGFAEAVQATGITGICGSGIIEAVAELFLAGVVTADGTIVEVASDRVRASGRVFDFVLWRGEIEIAVTQTDIRAIQLAKGALYAGARLLMDHLGVSAVERIKLAGAFGSYIDPKYAMVLGMIPDCPLERVSSIGNAAGTGARMALLNRGHRAEVEALVRRVEKIETALEPAFQAHFVNAMALPNAAEPFVHLAAAVALPAPAAPRERRSGRRRG